MFIKGVLMKAPFTNTHILVSLGLSMWVKMTEVT